MCILSHLAEVRAIIQLIGKPEELAYVPVGIAANRGFPERTDSRTDDTA